MKHYNKHTNDEQDYMNDELLVDECMEHAYSIITGKATYDSLLIKYGRVMMPYDPTSNRDLDSDDLIDLLIAHYEDPQLEEYEKCAELLEIKQRGKINIKELYRNDSFETQWDDWKSDENIKGRYFSDDDYNIDKNDR